jgi:phage terminase large subunit-like protein
VPTDERDTSPALELAVGFARLGAGARPALVAALTSLTDRELGALWYDWRGFWARSKQVLPPGPWRSLGFLTARGFGKTTAIAQWVNDEVEAGRAQHIGMAAQNEPKTVEVMVEGPAGLVTLSKPWLRARYEPGNDRVVWPNGAVAHLYTPEAPGSLRGPEHDLFWASELIAWPAALRDEAWANIKLGLRRGYGKLVWDTTPKRRHPMLRQLLALAKKYPERHLVVRGTTDENRVNLAPGVVEEWEDEYGGTSRGDEELKGIYRDDDDAALFKQGTIDRCRRAAPKRFVRVAIGVDPAFSTKKDTDLTGIVVVGLGVDGMVYVLEDLSGKHSPEAWGRTVVNAWKKYSELVGESSPVIVAERNKAGDLVLSNVRAWADRAELVVREWHEPGAAPKVDGIVWAKEVHATRSKGRRAEPVATAYEKGRIAHALGAPLEQLEDILTTWEPDEKHDSPDPVDALVHAVWELLELAEEAPRRAEEWEGLLDVNDGFGALGWAGAMGDSL